MGGLFDFDSGRLTPTENWCIFFENETCKLIDWFQVLGRVSEKNVNPEEIDGLVGLIEVC